MTEALREILTEAPPYVDGGAGIYNAGVLNGARVRPAFFDMSCLVYRLLYAKADVYCKKCGTDDGKLAHMAAADVMCDVADACRNFACAPILAFDSIRSLRTEQVYPEYKGGRGTQAKTDNEIRVLGCKNEVVRLLKCVYAPAYRAQSFCVHGYESDDIIASFVLGLTQHGLMEDPVYGKPIVIVSSDKDLHQLVIDNVYWADVTTGVLCKSDDLEKHYKIRTRDVVATKCVGGCHSDNIGNVPGCGTVSMMEVLAKRSDDVKLAKARLALQSAEGEAILRRNLRLIRLPFVGDPPMPPLRLCVKTWPKQGVPDDMAAMMDGFGIPSSDWPSFADITLPRPQGAIPVCTWNRKVKDETECG